MTEVHLVLLTHKGRVFNVSLRGSELNANNWGWRFVNGSCAFPTTPKKGTTFTLGPHTEKVCDNLKVAVELSSVKVDAPEWAFTFRGMPVYDRVSGPPHRMDIAISAKVADTEFAVPPHGIVGQSFDGDDRPRKGRLDVYPSRRTKGVFTTTAMAEGAIEGAAADYELRDPYDVQFKYSRFKHPSTPSRVRTNEQLLFSNAARATDLEEDEHDRVFARRLSECSCDPP